MKGIARNRAVIWRAKGEYERALSDYSSAIRLDPENNSHYGDRAYAYFYKGDFSAAASDFAREAEIFGLPLSRLASSSGVMGAATGTR